MIAARSFLVAGLWLAASSGAEDLVRVGEIGADAALRVAQARGFFKAEGIRIEAAHAGASADLMRQLHEGGFNVVHTNADNVVAWAEGQGADRQAHDFMIFVGGSRGLRLELVVPAEVRSFDDLKGKALAVDAYNTGYSPVLVHMLEKNGLILGRHYALEAVGAGGARTLALLRGRSPARSSAWTTTSGGRDSTCWLARRTTCPPTRGGSARRAVPGPDAIQDCSCATSGRW